MHATPQRYQKVKEIFFAAVDEPRDARTAFLRMACKGDAALLEEVERLFSAHDQQDGIMDQGLADLAAAAVEKPSQQPLQIREWSVGSRVGPYRLERLLAQGGMGEVYEARRDDDQYQRRVAIKLVRGGRAPEVLIQRFWLERQILAGLDHPNIAKLLDGGATEGGQPYLVMDYVDGVPLDTFSDEKRLSVADRLRLFLPICSAVHYAHQNLIVHRDLKPGNILVTAEGVPKLLDFGIAKLIGDDQFGGGALTRTGMRAMTPQYASPEQIRGEPVTTASDIYSLAVILYELLTGHKPYRLKTGTLLEVCQQICEDEPVRPSTAVTQTEERHDENGTVTCITPDGVSVARASQPKRLQQMLAGDLDMILLRAMHKDPQRRYRSVQEFADDIQRYFDGMPVLACKDSLRYRGGKFVRRHKMSVLAGALVAVSIVGGLAAATWQAHVARMERARTQQRFQEVRTLARWVLFDLHNAIEKLPGSTGARELLVRRVLEYVDNLARSASGDPSLQLELASAYARIGDLQWNRYYAQLGDYRGALENQRKALQIREAVAAAEPANRGARLSLAASYMVIGDLLQQAGDHRAALEEYRRSLAIRERMVAADPANRPIRSDLAITYQRIADTLGNPGIPNLGDVAGAAENYRRMQSIFEQLLAENPSDLEQRHSVAIGLEKLGRMEAARGNLTGALNFYRQELTGFQQVASAQPGNVQYRRDLTVGYGDVGEALWQMRRIPAALQNLRQMLAIREELFAVDPTNAAAFGDLQRGLRFISAVMARAGLLGEMRQSMRRLLEIQKGWADRPNANAVDLNQYAWTLLTCDPQELRSPRTALPYAQRAARMSKENDPNVLDTLSLAYYLNGDRRRAIETEERAIALASDQHGRAAMVAQLERFRTGRHKNEASRSAR
jgi:serine/threonine protein kinase/tetratricopeptide (TPR) repeat protein